MLQIIIGIIISYLIGSIPTAYILGWLLKGIDIRKFGSGNIGATNALRVLGKSAGVSVLILDILKGFLPVLFLGNFLIPRVNYFHRETLLVILGLGCIIGHIWTVFLGFKGGKGVAITLGALGGLAVKIAGLRLILGAMVATWLAVFLIARIVSIASVSAAIMLPIYMFFFGQSKFMLLATTLISIFIILRHRSNLKRFFRGEERRLF